MLTSTSHGLSRLPLPSLLRSTAIFHACGSDALVKAGNSAISRAVAQQDKGLLARPILAAARATIFNQFVAGETLTDARAIAQRLAAVNVRCIVDHSTEELEEECLRQHNLEAKLELLRKLSAELSDACSFVPVKMTGLISPTLLEQLTTGILRAEQKAGGGNGSDGHGGTAALPTVEEVADAARLDEDERLALSGAMARLRELCEGARAVGVPLLLDAEQTHRQPAIRLVARSLSAEFNRPRSGAEGGGAVAAPIVYDTHQCYLVGTEQRLRGDLAHARAHGYTLAVKLVRGAYRAGEAQRDPSVLQPSKAHTDAAYDACATLLLEAAVSGDARDGTGDGASGSGEVGVSSGSSAPSAALLVATHNRDSALGVVHGLQARGAPLSHPRVHFAQILGMADDLTLSLGLGGCNAHKLVPYGAFEEVLPWLLRRLDENNDALAAAAIERPLLRAELRRRALGALGLGGR